MREFALQFLSVLTNRVLQRGVNFFSLVLLARLVSVPDYGYYGVLSSTLLLACLLGTCGVNQSMTHLIGQKPDEEDVLVGTAALLMLPFGLIAALGALVCVLYFIPEANVTWFWPVLLSLLGNLGLSIAQGRYLGRGQITAFNKSETLPMVLFFLGIGGLFFLSEERLLFVAWALGLSTFCAGLFADYVCWRDMEKKPRACGTVAKKLVKQGVLYALAQFMANGNNTVSVYLLGLKGVPADAGYFFMSWQIYNAILNVLNALGAVLFSHSTRAKDPVVALKNVARLSSLLIWFMLLGALVFIVVAPWFVPFVFGAKFESTVPFIQLMMISIGFVTLSRLLYPTLGGLGMPAISFFLLSVALIVNMSLSWVLFDFCGPIGAVWSLIVSQSLLAAGYLLVIKIKFGLPIRNFLVPERSDLQLLRNKALSYLTRQKGELDDN